MNTVNFFQKNQQCVRDKKVYSTNDTFQKKWPVSKKRLVSVQKNKPSNTHQRSDGQMTSAVSAFYLWALNVRSWLARCRRTTPSRVRKGASQIMQPSDAAFFAAVIGPSIRRHRWRWKASSAPPVFERKSNVPFVGIFKFRNWVAPLFLHGSW